MSLNDHNYFRRPICIALRVAYVLEGGEFHYSQTRTATIDVPIDSFLTDAQVKVWHNLAFCLFYANVNLAFQ